MTVAIERFSRSTSPIHGTLFVPDGPHTATCVLVIGGSSGAEPAATAEMFAEAGIPALSVAYFKASGLPQHLRDIDLEYFERTALTAIARTDVPHVVVMGTSRGSEAALLTAIEFPDVVAGVVGVAPGNVVLCSWPPGGPAWLRRGQPLPYVSQFGPASAREDAIIPVERIRAPILLVSAGADTVWPSSAMARAIAERLSAADYEHHVQVLDYADAGHAIGAFSQAVRQQLKSSSADDAACADAWPKIVSFVKECTV